VIKAIALGPAGLMAYVIAAPCIGVKDTACVDASPVDVIHLRPDEPDFGAVNQLYIYSEDCICGAACVPVCPVSAIFDEDDLPEKWTQFVQINAEWFK
jgi:NAD-dependent dihydropyrimidine dehydrogenase PreA subunit